MSYDQVRQYLMSNPELWSGKGEAKEGPLSSVEATAKALEGVSLSKIPNISWHGSKNKNLIFGQPKEGKSTKSNMQLDFGTHFTNEEYASFYEGDSGKKYPAIIDLNSPLDLTQGMWWKGDKNFERVYQLIKDLKLEKTYGTIDYTDKEGNKRSDIQGVSVNAHKLTDLPPKRVSDALKKNGFDGIIYEPYHPQGGKYYEAKPKSFIVLNNSSIKEPTPINISEAYHAAKKDGSNPELVKAVEDLLGEKEGKEVAEAGGKYEKAKELKEYKTGETPDGILFLSESDNDTYSATPEIQWDGDSVAGNVSSIRGVWNKTKNLQFTGTTRVKNASDVAEIMSLLENKTVEHAFAVHVDKKGKSHIQFLGIGGLTGTVVDARMVVAGAAKFDSKKVYLVHNHPSGNLTPSNADVTITESISNALSPFGIEVGHVIMDTYKKEYTEIDVYGITTTDIKRKESKPETKLTTHILDEFEILRKPIGKVSSSRDAVNFIQQFRFSALPKNAVLILNQKNEVVANYVFQNGVNYNDLMGFVGKEVPQAIGFIFYGNQTDIASVKRIKARLEPAAYRVLDSVVVNSDTDGVIGYYESSADKGLLSEVQEEYNTTPIGGKEVPMPKAPYVQEVIPPINEEQAAGEKEMGALKKGDKITTTHPMRLLKGIYGKRNVDGSIRSAHTGVNGIFSSITEKIARRYEGEEGVVVFEIPAGVTVETVEIPIRIDSKAVPISSLRQLETDAINASDAQVVKLITGDSRGRESQYIIKDPALRKIGYKPSQREAEAAGAKQQDAVVKFLRAQRSDPNILGLNAGLWNGLLDVIEKAWLASKSAAKAIQAGIKWLKEQNEDPKEWEKYLGPVRERMQQEEQKLAGEKPPVTPPPTEKKTTTGEEGETKERKTITSIKGLEDISSEVKEALFGETTRYTVLPNQVSLNEANAILNAMGEEKAKALVLNGDENIPDAFRVTLGEVLIKKFNSEGKYNDAVDVAEGVAREATGWGQAIQALSLIKFLTPAGQLLAATRTINAIRDKRFKAEEGKMKRVKKAFQKADVEAIEGAIDAVVAQTEETPAPQATRAKTWGEKNKIVTKAVYEAAKKALKKFAFTGVPPELITIAAYHVEAGARSFADFSKEMVKDFGRKVRPYLKAAYKAAQKKVGGTGYSTDKEIAAHLATTLDRDIKEVMKESGIQIRDLIRQHLSEAERTKEAITKALVDKLGLRESDAAVIAAKVEAEYNRLATDKKAKALKAIERRLLRKTPVRKTAEKKLIELTNLGAFKEDRFKEEYARAMGFPEITKENAAKIEELANKVQNAKEGRPKFNAIINLLNYQASLPGVDKMDLATSVWMASLLSGPTTQLKNIFANSYNMGALALNVAAQSPKDIPFLLRGLTIGLGNGLQEGGSTMITGQSPIKQAAAAQGILERTKFSPYNPFGYYKFAPRFMLAADAVTYGGLKEMRAYQLALAEARDKYPTEKAVQKAIDILAQTDTQLQTAQAEAEQEYQEALAEIEADKSLNKVQREAKKAAAKLDRSRRVYDIVEQNRPNQLVGEAHDFALRGTFNNPPDGALGVAARFFNGITHKVPAVRFFVPFVNVITNVANEYVNYSPFGYWRAAKGGSITGNRKTFTEQDRKELMIKATIGTTAAIAAYVLSGIGGDDEEEPFFQITADGYNDYKKNKELEQTGWRPYSIKVGDRWISYKLTPMAAILASVGALRDKEKYGKEKLNENVLNKMVIPFQEFMSTVAETSFLGSAETFLSGVLGATKGDKGQKLVEWASKTGGAFVPVLGTNLYQQIAERTYDAFDIPDKEYRGVDGAIGIFAKMLRNVPVIRDEFQNAVNGLGEEPPPQTGGVIFSKKEAGPHAKLWQLLADKKATTGRPDRRGAAYIDVNGDQKAMNDEQFYFFAKTRGEYIRILMEANYGRLKDMDEKEFGKWMENARTSANRFANGELALQAEKGIYEKGIKKYKAEAEHEKDRLMYALERGDVKDAKSAFDNYEPLSTQTKAKDRNAIFVEIVKDDIAPTGIGSLDKIDFYKAVFLNQNPTIRIQEKQPNGKVKLVAKPFNQIFTEEERAEYKKMYEEREEDVVKKLSVLDQALQKKYTNMMSGDAIWRKYLKMGASKK